MTVAGPIATAILVIEKLETINVPSVLGGSLASSVVGEPRTTVDVDIAIDAGAERFEAFAAEFEQDFYVPVEAARDSFDRNDSFNILHLSSGFKVDLFVLGDGILDRLQIGRRVRLDLGPDTGSLWVTSSPDVVLRKLSWYEAGNRTSDRQWRDVLGVLTAQSDHLDLVDLLETARSVGLEDLATAAITEAGLPSP